MKKLSIFLAMIVAFAAFAIAAEHADNQMKDQTVEEINQMEEGEEVKLEGKLIENLDEENIYFFQDDTGIIEVEVSQDIWGDLQYDPEQDYEIKGEVVKDEMQGTVHVKANEIEEGKTPEEREQKRLEQQQKRDEARQKGQEKRQNPQDQPEEDDGFLF